MSVLTNNPASAKQRRQRDAASAIAAQAGSPPHSSATERHPIMTMRALFVDHANAPFRLAQVP